MATVRLFARLRELAGSSRVEIDGATVGDVVNAAAERFGTEFAATLDTARVWLNGEEADPTDPVSPGDEIALLPPVSGGAATVTGSFSPGAVVPGIVALVLVLLNLRGDEALWAAGLVAAAGVWAIDIAARMELRGRAFPAIAVVASAVVGAVLSSAMGAVGMTLAVAFAVVAVLSWGVFVAGYRSVDAIAPGAMVALLASSGVSSLVLSRSETSPDPEAVDVFLVSVILALALGALVDRFSQIPFLDPFTVTAVVAILAAVLTAFFRDLDVAGYLLVGLGLAVTLVAGRGLGGMLRTGAVALTETAPGFMVPFDGALLAASLFFPVIRLVL
ncbi:MAG TPA: MoaD/ThiS family protein [Acidimicrobiia bacterium]|jgi:MoaD family protein